MFAKGSLLSQVRPSASASTAFVATLRTEVTQIVVCNTTANNTTFAIYHDDDGVTFNQTTALYYDQTLSGNTSISIKSESMGGGLMLARGGSLGVKPGADLALTFSLYGVTEELASRI